MLSTTALSLQRWHHLAVTLDAQNNLTFFIDGKKDVTRKLEPAFTPCAGKDVSVGISSGVGGDFRGWIQTMKVTGKVIDDFAEVIGKLARANAADTGRPVAPAQPLPVEHMDPQAPLREAIFAAAMDSDLAAQVTGQTLAPDNVNLFDIREGKFIPGVRGKGFELAAGRVIRYPTPKAFPPVEAGTISAWILPGMWFTPQKIEALRKQDYLRRKTIFHGDGVPGPWAPWSLELNVVGEPNDKRLGWNCFLAGKVHLRGEQTLQPNHWYHVCVTWTKDATFPKGIRAKLFLDGQLVDEALGNELPTNSAGAHLNLGSTNAGVSYDGGIDEFLILPRAWSDAQVRGYFQALSAHAAVGP